ncbi:MAG: hypothetical protein ACF8QF_10990 [Phycisphaerales bacterium]
MRIGELMVRKGLLTEEQVEAILTEQLERGGAFGALAEELFGIGEPEVEDAWAEQYAIFAEQIDPRAEAPTADALALIDRRQAWQFRLMPLRVEGSEVVFVTTTSHLARALRFAIRHVESPAYFVLTAPGALAEALQSHYPMDGMDARFVEGRGFIRNDAA